MVKPQSIVAGIAAAGAAGATFIASNFKSDAPEEVLFVSRHGVEICLSTDLQFFEGASAGCYAPEELQKWANAQVLDNNFAPVAMNFSHPTDIDRDPELVNTCNDFRRLNRRGWYAASSREMRREAYFTRACRALIYLSEANTAIATHFDGGRLSSGDIASVASKADFRFIESPLKIVSMPNAGEDVSGALVKPIKASLTEQSYEGVSRVGSGKWGIDQENSKVQLQEMAHADFNGDGVGDVLVFVAIQAEGGTANVGHIGFLEKTEANGPVTFAQ